MPTLTFPVYETTHLRKTAKDLRALAADLARQADRLLDESRQDDWPEALHIQLDAHLTELARIAAALGLEL